MVMMIVPKFGLLLLLGVGPLATGLKFPPEQDTSMHHPELSLRKFAKAMVKDEKEAMLRVTDFDAASNIDEIFEVAESEFVRSGAEPEDEDGGGWFGDFEAWMDQEHTDTVKTDSTHFSWVPYEQVNEGCTADGVGCIDGDSKTKAPAKTCMSNVKSERSTGMPWGWNVDTNGGKLTSCRALAVCPAGYHMTKCECKYSAGCSYGLAITQKLEYVWNYVDRKDNNLGMVYYSRDNKGVVHQVMGRFGPTYFGYGSSGFTYGGTYNQNETGETRLSFTDDELTRGVCMGMQGPVPPSVNAGSRTAVEATCQTTWRHKIVNTTDFDDSFGNMMNLNANPEYETHALPKLKNATCPTGYKAVRCTCLSNYLGCTNMTGTDFLETTGDIQQCNDAGEKSPSGRRRFTQVCTSGAVINTRGACSTKGNHDSCYRAVSNLWNSNPATIIRDFSPKADGMTCEYQEISTSVKIFATCVHHETYSAVKNGIYNQVWSAANRVLGGEVKARKQLRTFARQLRKVRFLR